MPLDLATTGPAYAPQARVSSPTPDRRLAQRTLGATNLQQAFLDATGQGARDAAFQTGVPASVTVAQAILESDWGRSQLAQAANNYFGIKATSSQFLVWPQTFLLQPSLHRVGRRQGPAVRDQVAHLVVRAEPADAELRAQ